MKHIKMTSNKFTFIARLEEEKSPKTCEWFLSMLPYTDRMIHVSWSGNACFIRLQDKAYSVPYESPIRIPSKGELILYPGNEPRLQMGGELFMAWGQASIATANGNLSGNHFLTIIEGNENIEEYGRLVHTGGAQEITFELID